MNAMTMTARALLVPVVLAVAGCASSGTTKPADADAPPASTRGPNWDEIDKTVERVKDRERNKPRLVETEHRAEEGFKKMTDEEYAQELENARAEIKKAHPKMSDTEVEAEAAKRADAAKRKYELTYSRSASSTYELQRPSP